MMYQRGEHGMEQAHGGYSGGMRRSQSLVQGLFGWISPFHHTGPEPPASSSMDEDGNDDAVGENADKAGDEEVGDEGMYR